MAEASLQLAADPPYHPYENHAKLPLAPHPTAAQRFAYDGIDIQHLITELPASLSPVATMKDATMAIAKSTAE